MNNQLANWQRSDNDRTIVSLISSGAIAMALLVTLRFNILWALLILLFLFWAFNFVTQGRPYRVYRIFAVHTSIARQVIARVLDEKGLPYKLTGKRFVIGDGELEISFNPTSMRGAIREQMTSVSIGPVEDETIYLVYSLREKLEEAFSPRGL